MRKRSCPSFLDEPREETLATQATAEYMNWPCDMNFEATPKMGGYVDVRILSHYMYVSVYP